MEVSGRFVQVLSHHVPGGTEENHKNLSQDIRCPRRNSIRPPPGYKSEDLTACANLLGITLYSLIDNYQRSGKEFKPPPSWYMIYTLKIE